MINLYACIADPISEDEYLTRNMIWMEKIIGEKQ